MNLIYKVEVTKSFKKRCKNKEKEGKDMKNDISKSAEMMKKIIEERKAKSSKQKNTKRPPTYGPQSSSSGNGGGAFGK